MSNNSSVKHILPTFLGIGAMRSGTTWLDGVLRTHPQLYLPERRKEVHFFNKYYERGIDWYRDFFLPAEQSPEHRQIGEITPAYLYFPEVPARIKEHIPNCKFIIIFRNPVDRAYSHYGFQVKNYAEKRTFKEMLDREPEVFHKGLYGQQLERYLKYFPKENFFTLIYEEAIENPATALKQLGNFLAVDPNKFDLSDVRQKRNASGVVRFSEARAKARQFRDFLRNRDLDWIWNLAKTAGMERIFEGKSKSFPPMDSQLRAELISRYEPDIALLERLIGVELSRWKT